MVVSSLAFFSGKNHFSGGEFICECRHQRMPDLLFASQSSNSSSILRLFLHATPFSKDNTSQLGKIISVLGTPDLIAYIARFKIGITADVRKLLSQYSAKERSRKGPQSGNKRVPWSSLLTAGCPEPSPDGLDLLDMVLVYDHDLRLTAREAMAHHFFDAVRDRVTNEVRVNALADASY